MSYDYGRGNDGGKGDGAPQQIYHEVADVGKTIKASKKRAMWKFAFGEDPKEYEVTLKHSKASGKKVVSLKAGHQQHIIHESQQVSLAMWHHTFNVPGHMVRIQIDEDGIYDLFIDNIPFYRFEKRGADYLRRQAERERKARQAQTKLKAAAALSSGAKPKKEKRKSAAKPKKAPAPAPAPAPAEAESMIDWNAVADSPSASDAAFDPFGAAPAPAAPSPAPPAFDPFETAAAPPAAPQAPPAFDPFEGQTPALATFDAFGANPVLDTTAALAGLDFGAPAPAMAPATSAPAPMGVDPFAQPAAAPAAQTPKDSLAQAVGGGLVNLDGMMQPKEKAHYTGAKQPTLAELSARQPQANVKTPVMKAPPAMVRPAGAQIGMQQGGMGMPQGGMGMGMQQGGMGMQQGGMGMGMQQGGMGMQQGCMGMGMQQGGMSMGMGMQQGGMGMGMQQQQQGMGMGMGGMGMMQQQPPGGASAISQIGQKPQQRPQQQMGGDPFSGLGGFR